MHIVRFELSAVLEEVPVETNNFMEHSSVEWTLFRVPLDLAELVQVPTPMLDLVVELATQRAPSVLRRWEHRGDELVTLFQDGEHFWMLDERWGPTEDHQLRWCALCGFGARRDDRGQIELD